MMLEILAASLRDGWAFVREEKRVRLVRPPYRTAQCAEVSQETVQKAILTHGFTPLDKSFDAWPSLIKYLEDQLVETRKAAGYPEVDLEKVRNLVGKAPNKVLQDYLHRVEKEFLPNGEFNAAESLLAQMLRSASVRADDQLYERVISLLDRCNKAQQDRRAELGSLFDLQSAFPTFGPKCDRGTILALCVIGSRRPILPVGA